MSTPFSPFKHHFLVDYDLYPCILQCDDLCVDFEKTSSLGLRGSSPQMDLYELRAVLCEWFSVRRGQVTRRSSSLLSVWFLVRCEEVTRRSSSFLYLYLLGLFQENDLRTPPLISILYMVVIGHVAATPDTIACPNRGARTPNLSQTQHSAHKLS